MNIQQMVDKYLADMQQEKLKRTRSGKFNGSALGRCFQYQVWDREDKEKKPVDARTLRVFHVGNLFHEFIQDIVLKQYPDALIEHSYQDEDFICRADIIVDDEVISLKSQHSYAFWHTKKALEAGQSIRDIKRPHYLQVSAECVLNNKGKARLVYISKDDLCIEEYGFFNNEQMKDDVNNELSLLSTYWRTKKPLAEPRAYGYDKKTGKPNECYKYCQFKDKCFEINGEPKKG